MKLKIIILLILSSLSLNYINSMDEPLLDDAQEEDIEAPAVAGEEAEVVAIAADAPHAPAIAPGSIRVRLPIQSTQDLARETGELDNKLVRIVSCKGAVLCWSCALCSAFSLLVLRTILDKYVR